MSAGGMSVRNPRKALEPGDTLECRLEGRDRQIPVVARVTGTSRRGAIAHLEFKTDDASTRHRILELLFTRTRRSA
jgi:hypothetical protein